MTTRRHPWFALAVIVLVVMGASKAVSWWTQARTGATIRQHVKPGDITMYTTETCPYCVKARDWMRAQQIPWRECDVERNATCQQAYAWQGAPGTPLMEVKGRWGLGFNADWLSRAVAMPPLRRGPTSPAAPDRPALPEPPPPRPN